MKVFQVLFALVVSASASLPFFSGEAKNPCPPRFTGMLPNPDDCHSFYMCANGVPNVMQCPASLCFLWDGEAGGDCDNCDIVPGCGVLPPRTTTSATTTSTTTTPTTTTPTTTTSTTTTTTTTTTEPPTTTPSTPDLPCPDDPYIYLPYPGDCNKFYYCIGGVNTGVFNCQPEPLLWFNFQQQACVKPWGETCSD